MKLPDHIEGLLKYLSHPLEKSNEDLAVGYFRKVFPGFTRQADAKKADGYVPGHFVLELKGKTSSWFRGFFQGLAYKRDLDLSLIVVAAKHFLAVWKVEDLPESIRKDVLSSGGAANSVGRKFASKYASRKSEILRKAIWRGDDLFGELVLTRSDLVRDRLRTFESTIRTSRKVRQRITTKNFTRVLAQMVQFFDREQPIKAVRAFYSMIYGWNEESILQISLKADDQATLGGEIITDLVPGKRLAFKDFGENHTVWLGENENYDDFFAHYDEALDTVDRSFRIQHGIFFTDLDLSKFVMWIVKQHLPELGKNYLVIDPACGCGNLVTNWRSPLELRHKVVSEIEPELLFAVEKRMKGDAWHRGKFTVVPKVSENKGLNLLNRSAADYIDALKDALYERGLKPDKPIAFLCNPPYRSDDDQAAAPITYKIHPSIIQVTGKDASSERYCCFLAQMKLICQEAPQSRFPGDSLLLIFTKAVWLTRRPVFQHVRREILESFDNEFGVLINAQEFFDTKVRFPIAFSVWRYVGQEQVLNPDRNIPLVDLTWLTKHDLNSLPWTDEVALDRACEAILRDQRSTKVSLGVEREQIKVWIGQKRIDFMRNRRKDETGAKIVGGLPRNDQRMVNKKAYGDSSGVFVGFMDDLTPCRTNKYSGPVPYFHLDSRFMRVRDYRCFSGHSDHRSFAAETRMQAERLFLWYLIGRTFADHGYPMWVDADEIWVPNIPDSLSERVLKYSLAVGFSDNECVETTFPANNPVDEAPEVFVLNPMAPTNPESFWGQNLAEVFSDRTDSTQDRLVSAVEKLYEIWRKRFQHGPELAADYEKPYFVGPGVLRTTSGITQIKDYAVHNNDQQLIEAYQQVQGLSKRAKEEFYNLLLDKGELNYFGEPKVRKPSIKKVKGRDITATKPEARPVPVIDILNALKRTAERIPSKGKAGTTPRGRRKA